jgi:hypothetical protein
MDEHHYLQVNRSVSLRTMHEEIEDGLVLFDRVNKLAGDIC